MTHICVIKLTTIGSDAGLSPGRHQAVILTNTGILLFGPLGAKFGNRNSNILIHENAIENLNCKMASIYLDRNVLGSQRTWCTGEACYII